MKRKAGTEGGEGAGFSTRAVHAGQAPDPGTGAIMTPIYLSSTYVQAAPGKHKGYEYSRTANPTRTALEANLAALEGGDWGLAFSSGCAAANTVCNLLELGDHVVAGNDLYGGTHRLFRSAFEKMGVVFSFVDTACPGEVEKALRRETKLLWMESPSNPLLRITDLRDASGTAHAAGVSWVVVDSTFATPYLQNPLELGADLVVHSTTKYLGGHSDVVGGAIVGRDAELRQRLGFFQNTVGAIPGPFDAWLVLRGVKTLAVRMERHCANAEALARFLDGHPAVSRVAYPGLPGDAGYEVACRQMRGFGGMISLELKGGMEKAMRFLTSLRLFALAESLGGVESLVEHPASMTHAAIPREEREAAGLGDGLIRLSVGIEDLDDLRDDLQRALG